MGSRIVQLMLLLAIVVGAWMLLLRPAGDTPIVGHSLGRGSGFDTTGFNPVEREDLSADRPSLDTDGPPWFLNEEDLAAFQKEVMAFLYSDGGLERALHFIDEHSHTPNHDRNMREIQDAADDLRASGLIPLNPELFMGTLYGADMGARNRILAELRNYHAWIRDRERPDFHWPEFEITHDPFRLVPEMLTAYLAGEKMGVELSETARNELADLRDQNLLQMLALEQDLQVRRGAVEYLFQEFQKRQGGG